MLIKKHRIITIVNGALALIIMGAFLLLVRNIISLSFSPAKKSPAPTSAAAQGKTEPKKELMDYSAVLKKNPFGFYAGELSSLISKSGGAVVADVILVGTVSGHKKFAYAIFADKNSNQEIFKLGEAVFGLGKLQAVEKDFVVLDGKKIQIADIVTIREVAQPAKTNAPLASSDAFAGDKFARKMTDTSYMVDAQRVQQALINPNQIMTDARLVPNFVDGKQEGFIMKEIKQGGIYQSLGLQNGDVLLKINDYAISNPESGLQAFTALKGMDKVQLDIIRSGARMSMSYQIK